MTAVDLALFELSTEDHCSASGVDHLGPWQCQREILYKAGRLCPAHYQQYRSGISPLRRGRQTKHNTRCHAAGEGWHCTRRAHGAGYCVGHYHQHRDGRPLAPLRDRRPRREVCAVEAERLLADGMKRCLACRLALPLDRYYPTPRSFGGRHNKCRWCESLRGRFDKYHLTRDEWTLVMLLQDRVCAACGASDPRGSGGWQVDHDHACCPGRNSCGECVRGGLCSECNWQHVPWYERLPPQLRTWPRLNAYLAGRPIVVVRRMLAETGGSADEHLGLLGAPPESIEAAHQAAAAWSWKAA